MHSFRLFIVLYSKTVNETQVSFKCVLYLKRLCFLERLRTEQEKGRDTIMAQNHQSDYLRTKQHIEEEREAALRGLLGPAVVAYHASIEASLTRGAHHIHDLIKQQRLSDAMELMEHPSWGEDDYPPSVNASSASEEKSDAATIPLSSLRNSDTDTGMQ